MERLKSQDYKSLNEKIDYLVSVETYRKERLEASQQAEKKLKLELDNMAKDLAMKNSNITALKKRIEEQEKQFEIEVKQYEAVINALLILHNRL
ncbi:hypothetical protein AB6A40_003119 [Gnathostoma spinigerum]|uniref:Uncharacterized protein n=1 Tax=Gnathostoma spinigerum TaxID=75299 RepID=A0ABD6EJF3_9BILA